MTEDQARVAEILRMFGCSKYGLQMFLEYVLKTRRRGIEIGINGMNWYIERSLMRDTLRIMTK